MNSENANAYHCSVCGNIIRPRNAQPATDCPTCGAGSRFVRPVNLKQQFLWILVAGVLPFLVVGCLLLSR